MGDRRRRARDGQPAILVHRLTDPTSWPCIAHRPRVVVGRHAQAPATVSSIGDQAAGRLADVLRPVGIAGSHRAGRRRPPSIGSSCCSRCRRWRRPARPPPPTRASARPRPRLYGKRASAPSGRATAPTSSGSFPYSAAQLAANDQYKRIVAGESGELTVPRRLVAGRVRGNDGHRADAPAGHGAGCGWPCPTAGTTAWATRSRRWSGPRGSCRCTKGLVPTLVGIAPYAALNFASYDLLEAVRVRGRARSSRAR